MLLAHSRAAAHCEPITVILAEVEAPELAALLGFIYTGSTTVPRVRLDAFLRAAEALRIRLPPVPVVMTCDGDGGGVVGGGGGTTVATGGRPVVDCKLEDAKEDVKVSPKYLRYDRYPSSDEWWRYRPARPSPPYVDSLEGGKEPRPDEISFPLTDDGAIVLAGDRGEPRGREIDRRSPVGIATSCGPTCPSTWSLGGVLYRCDRTTADPVGERDRHGSSTTIDRIVPHGVVTTPAESCPPVESTSSSFNVYQRSGACCPPTRGYGGLEEAPMERLGTTATVKTRTRTTEKPADSADFLLLAAESNEFCERTRDDRECPSYPTDGTTTSTRPSSSSLQRATSLLLEKRDYELTRAGQDPSPTGGGCNEGCCGSRWRSARRHVVANRVTASPWRQIVRPHHSPRTRPVVVVDVSTNHQSLNNTRL